MVPLYTEEFPDKLHENVQLSRKFFHHGIIIAFLCGLGYASLRRCICGIGIGRKPGGVSIRELQSIFFFSAALYQQSIASSEGLGYTVLRHGRFISTILSVTSAGLGCSIVCADSGWHGSGRFGRTGGGRFSAASFRMVLSAGSEGALSRMLLPVSGDSVLNDNAPSPFAVKIS